MSSEITTKLIKELRDSTGISIMQCKHALEEAEGDMKKALVILKKTSSDIALKKANREVKNGAVTIKKEGNKTILVALLCETDFVAKSEDFINLLNTLADKALKAGVAEVKMESKSMIDPVIQKTGENIQLGEIYEISGEVVGSYVHNNKLAVIVSLKGGDETVAKDIAMHIAAMKPEYISKNDIDEDTKKTITEVFQKELVNIDKTEDIKKKILEGKISTYFKEKTLLDQQFIKNSDLTIQQLLDNTKAQIVEIKRYTI